jgi:hypothetical protein
MFIVLAAFFEYPMCNINIEARKESYAIFENIFENELYSYFHPLSIGFCVAAGCGGMINAILTMFKTKKGL